MFFSSWGDLGRIIVATSVIFILIIAMLRIAGPQALARMSSFDFVFAVSLGSIIATVAVTHDITISEAASSAARGPAQGKQHQC
jgi:uncharacterized membrane protein YcaP (DUF421 family)